MKLRPTQVGFVVAITLALTGAATHSFGARRGGSGGASDARVTEVNLVRVTTTLLEQSQFSHHRIDRELATKWLDRYLDELDSRHAVFLQSDVEQFAGYLPAMAEATQGEAKTSVPHTIFARYLERMEQQVTFMTAELRNGSFDFTGKDRYRLDWEHAPRPRDLATAQALWRQQLRAEYLQEKLNDKKPAEIVKLLTRRHGQQLKTMKGLADDEVLEVYLDALAHVYDPHSNYLGREEMENMAIGMNLSLVGIGASLRLIDGYCTIHELIAGGPGARSGKLKPGDRIIAVAQGRSEPVDVVDMPLGRTVQMIRGKKGTQVTLTILPAGAGETASKTVTLVRDQIKLEDQAAKAFIVDWPNGATPVRLGVLDLPSFYAELGVSARSRSRSATADVARLLTKLKAEHVRGLVLDLRRNGGGALEEAIQLTGLFIRKGPVVQTRDLRGRVEVDADEDPAVQFDGPMIVLTSRFSASASEIVAGALQDYERAVIVGDSSTFGKGTVQNIVPLAPVMAEADLTYSYDPGALLITIRKFYRPSGSSTQLKGVASDIVLPSLSDLADVSESSLPDPLPWDSIAAVRHDRLNRVRPHLAALAERSAKRRQENRGFALLGEAVARIKKNLDSKSVSLNEAERRQDMAKSRALEKALKEERRKAQASLPKTYAITLANAGQPGLPAPLSPSAAKSARTATEPGSDDLAEDSAGRLPAEEIVLEESERILLDYIERVSPRAP